MHTKIIKHQNAPISLIYPLVLNQPKEPASTPRTSIDLASLIYKGKHAQFKNKYFWSSKNYD
jgi:hypothetical protein